MNSLKAFLPQLADIFGTTSAALYERQRVLVRLGVLAALEGRGPGSGVPLTTSNVAALILALAVTDNLSDTDERVQRLCEATPKLGSVCPLTEATNLRDALAAILSSTKLVKQMWLFSVERDDLSAVIFYKPRIRVQDSLFVQPIDRRSPWRAINTKAFIGSETFHSTEVAISRSLAERNGGDGGEE
jgi:hypothetical protein